MKHVIEALKFLLDAHAATAISPSSASAAADHSAKVDVVSKLMNEADVGLSIGTDATAVLNAGMKLAADIKKNEAAHQQ